MEFIINKANDYTVDKTVAYFDFDGTLTTIDTLIPFILFVVGGWKFFWALPFIAIIVLLYLTKIINNEQAKERFLSRTIKGLSKEFLDKKAQEFINLKLDKFLKPNIYAKLESHINNGHQVILVSANLGVYLRYWAIKHKIDHVIATEIEFINNCATGLLATHNCYGKFKVERIEEFLQQQSLSFNHSYGYGNSAGDYALLNYVDTAYWIDGNSISNWADKKNVIKC